jgi:hypothetical protein
LRAFANGKEVKRPAAQYVQAHILAPDRFAPPEIMTCSITARS